MSGGTAATAPSVETMKAPSMGVFERYLTVWVALCIVVGIVLGQAAPGVFRLIGEATVAEVNLPVAVLVWLMIVPMLLKIDLAALGQVRKHWRGIAATVGVNWLQPRARVVVLAETTSNRQEAPWQKPAPTPPPSRRSGR